jgi:hypothetical protein
VAAGEPRASGGTNIEGSRLISSLSLPSKICYGEVKVAVARQQPGRHKMLVHCHTLQSNAIMCVPLCSPELVDLRHLLLFMKKIMSFGVSASKNNVDVLQMQSIPWFVAVK